jgi:hypothetical protein
MKILLFRIRSGRCRPERLVIGMFLLGSCIAGCGDSTVSPTASGATVATAKDSPPQGLQTSVAPSVVDVHPAADSARALSSLKTSATEKPKETPAATLTQVDPSRLVGCWQDSFFGKRTLILKADGTARMVLDLDFAGQLLYGKRLDFDMRWSLDGAKVVIEIISGRPEKAAKSAMKTWGEIYEYNLECVEDHEVQMRSSDGSMFHKLQRLPAEAEAASR